MAHEMVIRSDARAMGAVTAITPHASRWYSDRLSKPTRATVGDCKITKADGTTTIIAGAKRNLRKASARQQREVARLDRAPAMTYAERIARFGAVGNIDG